MTAARRRLIVTELCEHFSVSQRRAARSLDLPRSSLRYAPVARDEQAALARRIEELAGRHPRFGYRRIWALLDREGWSVNKKAVRRIWRSLGLKLAGPRAARAGRERVPPPAVARERRCMDMGLHLRPYRRRPEPQVAEPR
jgi:putative transposase